MRNVIFVLANQYESNFQDRKNISSEFKLMTQKWPILKNDV